MENPDNLYKELCNYKNLLLSFQKARKHKTKKHYVIEFEKNLKQNLLQLRTELLFHIYKPKPLETFIIRDPKTRKISKSDFRDRIVHHALCNIIEPIFDKTFIHDSYANRKGKGTLAALKGLDYFKRKASKNNTKNCFVLKADIKHYFETVDHEILLSIIKRKIRDEKVIWLIRKILDNFERERERRGMPLGNLTSQFFANVYLNEIDYFVKHKLKARYYIRYVDDFIILNSSKKILEKYKININTFLKINLKLELHKDKSKIKALNKGISFLGFRVFYYHKLLKKANIQQMKKRLLKFKEQFETKQLDYDKIYSKMEGWLSYASNGNTYNLRLKLIRKFEEFFLGNIASIEISRWLRASKTKASYTGYVI